MADRTEEVLLAISIDTECDHDPDWARSRPLRFDSINRGLPEVLQPAFESVGAVPTYLLTVEVLEDDEAVRSLSDLSGSYEYGTHLHPAFIEPQKKFHDYAGIDSPDFQCGYPPAVEYEKLKNLTDLFESRMGYRPTSFRAGRYGAGPCSIDALERLGYRVDTSVTPHLAWKEPNAFADFRRAPEQPYFPRPGTIDTPGPVRDILEVPVSMRKRLLRGPKWFRPWLSTVDQMRDVVSWHLRENRHHPVVVLNMMFHSMEVIPGASPYPQSNDEVCRFVDDMISVLYWCSRDGIRFTGLSELHGVFRELEAW